MAHEQDAIREALWKLYAEHCTHVRHHESQRTSVAATFIAISGALLAFATFDKQLASSDLPVTLLIIAVGLFGALFSAKQWERASMHTQRARQYRDEIDAMLVGAPIKQTKRKADATHNNEFRWLHKLNLHQFWIVLYLIVSLLGIALSVIALWFPVHTP